MGAYGSPEMLDFLEREPIRCKKCGAVVEGKFCANCGTRVFERKQTDSDIPWIIAYTVPGITLMLFAAYQIHETVIMRIFNVTSAMLFYTLAVLVICAFAAIKRAITNRGGPWLKKLIITNLVVLGVSFVLSFGIYLSIT